ncbi:MAG TPA: FAD-dependent oxidoreductase [Acetobacteraceae bacterium]|nr:FAD-dependent oxidoreductase [Acetobacteraceae bacterium]
MQKAAEWSQLRDDRGLRVDIGGTKILLVRDGGAVCAYSALCPHANGPLEEGAVCNGRIVCPWHKGAFRVSDGTLLEPPPLDPLPRYPVEVRDDGIYVDPTEIPRAPATRSHDDRVVLIAGAGAAGGSAAAALREFGFGGRVLLVGHEGPPPFDRTSLSKFVMAGQMKPQDAPPLRPAGFYAAQQIERVGQEVLRLDAAGRRAVLADGREIAFDAAVIATGGVPKSLDIPGADLPGVHVLRSQQDAAAILADVRPGARAVILGSSFIGLEVASGFVEQKVAVSVVAPVHVPFAPQFGPRIGAAIRTLHEAHGVQFHLPAQAARINGDGHAAGVVLEDGMRLPADLVVIGVGVRPATDFVAGIPRGDDGSLAADAGMRVAEGIYAAGDIASFPLPQDQRRVRVEHWRVAQEHARIAASNIAGGRASYDDVPFFWTYHYGKRIEYLGHAESWDEIEIDGELGEMRFLALLLRRGMVAAIVACQRERETALLAEPMRHALCRAEAREILRRA